MVRHKTELIANAAYVRKITWLVSNNDVAVVEYKGKYVEGEAHGNNRRRYRLYVRTPAITMDDISSICFLSGSMSGSW